MSQRERESMASTTTVEGTDGCRTNSSFVKGAMNKNTEMKPREREKERERETGGFELEKCVCVCE